MVSTSSHEFRAAGEKSIRTPRSNHKLGVRLLAVLAGIAIGIEQRPGRSSQVLLKRAQVRVTLPDAFVDIEGNRQPAVKGSPDLPELPDRFQLEDF